MRDASPVDHLDLAGEMARWSGVRTADELVLRRPGAGSFRGDDLTENEAERTNRTTRSAAVATGVACFLAELGDKTMLATITLANTEGVIGTWGGSTVCMVAADALAILVGAALGKKLPERAVRIGATLSFVIFGLFLIAEGIQG